MIWAIIGAICFATLVVIGLMQSATLRARRHVSGRVKLTEEEFADKFFAANQRSIAIRARQLLAPYLPVNVGRIRPTDRLVGELGLGAGDGLDGVALLTDIEREFKCEFSEADVARMETLQQLVDTIADKTSKIESV